VVYLKFQNFGDCGLLFVVALSRRGYTGPMNKKVQIIACGTLRDEVTRVTASHADKPLIHWMPDGLHAHPQQMRGILQKAVDACDGARDIRLAYGGCGLGTEGLVSDAARLVIPRCDDCITILLKERADLADLRTHTYFLTRGWLDGRFGLEKELDVYEKTFGSEGSRQAIGRIYEAYDQLMLIDTQSYDLAPAQKRTAALAKRLALEPVEARGSLRLLEKLLYGPIDKDFAVFPPGTPLSFINIKGKGKDS
jgi:hypothetical protein